MIKSTRADSPTDASFTHAPPQLELQTEQEQRITTMYAAHGVKESNLSLGLPAQRTFPIEIYLQQSDAVSEAAALAAIQRVCGLLDATVILDFAPERGSWFMKLFARTKKEVTVEQLFGYFDKLKHGIELNGIYKPQADVDKAEAEAASAILVSLKDTPSAVIKIGSLLIVKHPYLGLSHVVAITLTSSQMIYLNQNCETLTNPYEILNRLKEAEPMAGNITEAMVGAASANAPPG